LALFAVLSTLAVGCQKDNVSDFVQGTSISESSTVYTVLYSVNGVQHKITLYSEAEHQAFIRELLALAKQGYTVIFYDENSVSQTATKEVVTYSTSSEAEAVAWMVKMEKDGYYVSVTFDDKTNTFNCIAWR
jgi:UDP-N-acetylmuramate-alanine ligase